MSWVAVAVGGGAIVGGVISSNATSGAAQTQADAANHASDIQKQIFEEQRADQAPWREAGVNALSGLASPDFQHSFTKSDFQADPGYDFRMEEGQKALERSAAARGGLQGGATLKALSRYGQDYASNEYQNAYNRFTNDQSTRFNRLSSIAGLGQTANNQVASAGMNYANNVGSNMMGAANAQGAAGIANANMWGNTLSSLGNNALGYSMMNRFAPSGGGLSLSGLGGGGGGGSSGYGLGYNGNYNLTG